jgi:aldehyde dehydrogenase (NAD+)
MTLSASDDQALVRNYVDGEWMVSRLGRRIEIREPSRASRTLWYAVDSSPDDMRMAIDAAAGAQETWRRSSGQDRAAVLEGAASHLSARIEEVATDLALEQGKTLVEARREVRSAILSLQYFAGQAMEATGDLLPRAPDADRVWAERIPLGVVACITPWNFPLLIPTYKVAPALAFGNTVVLKPASLTPRAAAHLFEALAAAKAPPGTVNLCLGDGAVLSDAILNSAHIRGVSFTGSNSVGRLIEKGLVGSTVRVQLEMGGKNPVIVLKDADLERSSGVVVEGSMGMAGQRCTATSRVIVERSRAPELLERVRLRVNAIRVGHPLSDGVTMGPVISEVQMTKILGAIEEGRRQGASLVVGGTRLEKNAHAEGYYVAPTIFDHVQPEMALARDEIFGPVLGVISVDSVEEAVHTANDTSYGLTASVCTRDLTQTLKLIDQLDFGVIQVNRPTSAIERYAPFGGLKQSGLGGREQGRAARDFYTEWKTVYVAGA